MTGPFQRGYVRECEGLGKARDPFGLPSIRRDEVDLGRSLHDTGVDASILPRTQIPGLARHTEEGSSRTPTL
jgi:hypothetical protein